MKPLPLVSIVTPAYNQGEYLAETIESVLAQDYQNLEYIVLDDGSTDSTPDVLAKYTGRVKHVRHENIGQARTLNKGWDLSSGSLLGYISSDDRLRPHAISALVKAFDAAPDIGVAYGDYDLIDGVGRRIRTVYTEAFDAERLTTDLVCQPGAGALFRRDLRSAAGYWDTDLSFVADFEFWLRCSKRSAFLRVPQLLADFRVHAGSGLFKPLTVERATEIVGVMRSYWQDADTAAARRSVSNAHLMAARNHAQSGRYLDSIAEMGRAAKCDPESLAKLAAWRALAAGMFRRGYYIARSKIGPRP